MLVAAHERGCESADLIRISAGKKAGVLDGDRVIVSRLALTVRAVAGRLAMGNQVSLRDVALEGQSIQDF